MFGHFTTLFMKALIEKKKKNRDIGSEKYILLDFAKYLSFSEVQKNSKVVNVEGSLF